MDSGPTCSLRERRPGEPVDQGDKALSARGTGRLVERSREHAALLCPGPFRPSWKQQDPQLPKSIWYHTDAQWLGFRLVRPAKVPSAEEMYDYWNSGVERLE